MPAILGQSAFAFELRNGGRIRGVAVGVDHPRHGMVRSAQRFCGQTTSSVHGVDAKTIHVCGNKVFSTREKIRRSNLDFPQLIVLNVRHSF